MGIFIWKPPGGPRHGRARRTRPASPPRLPNPPRAACSKRPWDVVILDEAQAIKSPATRQTCAVKEVNSQVRFALTSTLVENRASDLWSIFDFKEVAKLQKNGKTITPVEINGRKIAASFWSKAWCDHLESYSDYANRLPRGRTYVRNGSVVHLEIRNFEIEATVSGSSLYKISITITPVPKAKWQALCKQCAGGIGSLVELLQAKLSASVMTHISHRENNVWG